MSFTCLGVRIDSVAKQEALDKIRAFLYGDSQYKVYTPNPEMLVEAHKNPEFQEILNKGDLNVCDGVGIVLMNKLLSLRGALRRRRNLVNNGIPTSFFQTPLNDRIQQRISGSDLMLDICMLAEKQGNNVYFLGAGATEKFCQQIEKRFPKLHFASSKGHQFQIADNRYQEHESKEGIKTIEDIKAKGPCILFVGFGHYKQEWWIDTFLRELLSVKVAMGVGGAFDFISGKAKRAPRVMRMIGLEWLWRLILEPKRVKRIWKAVVVFPTLVIRNL